MNTRFFHFAVQPELNDDISAPIERAHGKFRRSLGPNCPGKPASPDSLFHAAKVWRYFVIGSPNLRHSASVAPKLRSGFVSDGDGSSIRPEEIATGCIQPSKRLGENASLRRRLRSRREGVSALHSSLDMGCVSVTMSSRIAAASKALLRQTGVP